MRLFTLNDTVVNSCGAFVFAFSKVALVASKKGAENETCKQAGWCLFSCHWMNLKVVLRRRTKHLDEGVLFILNIYLDWEGCISKL